MDPDNPHRRPISARFVVGLSGNLGFTHDPVIVFEAARLLRESRDIHFLLSGLGDPIRSVARDAVRGKASERHAGRSRRGRPTGDVSFCADVWIIPYRQNVAGVSVPFYNLLAIGRPVILISEPDAEAAPTVTEHDVCWVVEPGRADELAKTVSGAPPAPRTRSGPGARS